MNMFDHYNLQNKSREELNAILLQLQMSNGMGVKSQHGMLSN